MSTTLAIDEATDAYRDVERLIGQTVNRFANRYGVDEEEAHSVANQTYVSAIEKHDPTRSKFTTYLVRMVWWELQRWQTREKKKSVPTTPAHGFRDIQSSIPTRQFDLNDFIVGLSKDAATVVRLVFNSPGGLACAIVWKGGHPANYRSCIRSYLHEIGWGVSRIENSFAEVWRELGQTQ